MAVFYARAWIAVFLLSTVPDVGCQYSNETADTAKESLLLQLFDLSPSLLPGAAPVNPPEYMTELFHKVSDENGLVRHPDVFKGNHVHSFLDRGHINQSILFFNVSSIILHTETILRADLMLFKLPDPSSSSLHKFPKPVSVAVEIIDAVTGSTVSVQLIPSRQVGWQKFPLSIHLVENWLQNRSSNDGLVIRFRSQPAYGKVWSPESLKFAGRGQRNTNRKQPILVVYCNNPVLGKKSRARTASSDRVDIPRRPERSTVNRNRACQRYKMSVDFRALGWHTWVIMPRFYSAFHCAGRCTDPINAHSNPTTHAVVQSKMAAFGVAEPCCVPMTLASISLLYYEDKEKTSIALKVISDMVVDSCACH